MSSQTMMTCTPSTIDRVASGRVWRRFGILLGYQFILVLNTNRYAPFGDSVNLARSESSDELIDERSRSTCSASLVSGKLGLLLFVS
jgi:hypothetical protein